MSPLRFEKINGHTPVVTYDSTTGLYKAECECACGEKPVGLWGGWFGAETRALDGLLMAVYAEHSQIVMTRANWQCETCGAGGVPLSAHHVVFRSHGRDDRTTNLKAQCSPCHDSAHGIKRAHVQ